VILEQYIVFDYLAEYQNKPIMENIDINFLLENAWMEYPASSMAPKKCFHKNTYPIALWWDEYHEVFFVVDLKNYKPFPGILGENPIKTVEDYNKLISPILMALKDAETAKNK
jgi:hypothetical protein